MNNVEIGAGKYESQYRVVKKGGAGGRVCRDLATVWHLQGPELWGDW